MRTNWKSALLALGVLTLTAAAEAAAPSAAMLVAACGGCHGSQGVSAGVNMPSLAGQRKDYFVIAMKGFKNGERPATVMGRLAQGFSDTEIEIMADFFAAQPPVRQSGPLDAKLVEKGKAIFYKQCKFCHLDNRQLWGAMHQRGEYDTQCRRCHATSGPDAKDGIPVVAGQWLNYLETQLLDFKNGKRKMAVNKAQRLNPLSRQDLVAVAHFCASQAAE